MVDTARALLDELMGRNRNLDPSETKTQVNWEDPEYCQYFLVRFCPHDLFVNTKADLGQCQKLHDEEAKKMFDDSKSTSKKIQYEDEFLRFCSNMLNEVDRKILKGKQRLTLMNNKNEARPISKQQEQINTMTDKINKLLREAEDAGLRGDVDQAQGLMALCDQLKEEKETVLKQHEGAGWAVQAEFPAVQEKQMEVCEVCGAFLIVGDAQQRIDDHLTGKQHLGYDRLRKAVDNMYLDRQKEREDDDKKKEDERKRRVSELCVAGSSANRINYFPGERRRKNLRIYRNGRRLQNTFDRPNRQSNSNSSDRRDGRELSGSYSRHSKD